MTTTRSQLRHGRRASFTAPRTLDFRLLPPLTRRALRRVSNLGTLTILSARTLAIACLASSLGTALFAVGFLLLVRR